MEAAVDVDHFASAEGKCACGNRNDGFADVFGLAPTRDGRKAFGDEGVVLFFYARGHVGGDDAGANFENINAVFGEARGKEFGHHGKAGFGNAVVAAGNGRGVGADGGDGDDLGARVVWVGFGLVDHPAGSGLGEEVGTFRVDVDEAVEAFFFGFEDVGAFGGGDAGVVYQEVKAVEFFAHRLDETRAICGD